jgi:hypothetical protein
MFSQLIVGILVLGEATGVLGLAISVYFAIKRQKILAVKYLVKGTYSAVACAIGLWIVRFFTVDPDQQFLCVLLPIMFGMAGVELYLQWQAKKRGEYAPIFHGLHPTDRQKGRQPATNTKTNATEHE